MIGLGIILLFSQSSFAKRSIVQKKTVEPGDVSQKPAIVSPACLVPRIYFTSGYLAWLGQIDLFFETAGQIRFEYNPNWCKERSGIWSCDKTLKKRVWQEEIVALQEKDGIVIAPVQNKELPPESKDWFILSTSSWMVSGMVNPKVFEEEKKRLKTMEDKNRDLKKLEQYGAQVQIETENSALEVPISIREDNLSMRFAILLRKDAVGNAETSPFGTLVTRMVKPGIWLHAALDLQPNEHCNQ